MIPLILILIIAVITISIHDLTQRKHAILPEIQVRAG